MRNDPLTTPEPFGRDEGRVVFGSVAELYAAARPDYPERVYDILRERCHLGPSSRVVEIGPGSGQATKRFVDAGATVVAVEPSEALATQLLSHMHAAEQVQVVVGAFEDVVLPIASFDLAAAATAYHWLDADRALPKIVTILRPGGWLALWWNVFGDPNRPDPFHDATKRLEWDVAPSPSAGRHGIPFALDVSARVSELTAHRFDDIAYEVLAWTLVLDAAQTQRLYATYSNIARLPDAERARMLDGIRWIAEDRFDGRVERQMLTPIYTARSRPA